MKRSASAVWKGGLKDGTGTVSTETGTLSNVPYNFRMRFENEKGTNPEELIAAAHAACFSMALSMILGDAGMKAESISTKATVTLEQVDGGLRRHVQPARNQSEDSQRRPRRVSESRRRRQERLSDFKASQRQDHDGRQARLNLSAPHTDAGQFRVQRRFAPSAGTH